MHDAAGQRDPTVLQPRRPIVPIASPADATVDAAQRSEQRLEGLIDRLPRSLRRSVRWLRRPSSLWARIPACVLLIGGGLLSILPGFGLWMLPLGLLLLAEDIPPLRRGRDRALDWIERRRPHWIRRSGA
jgi:hypothetical protein